RGLDEGELVPVDAITAARARTQTRLVLTVPGPLSDLVTSGSRVDVWGAAPAERNTYEEPILLASGVVVVRVIDTEGFMASKDQVSLELQVDKDTATVLMESMVRGDAQQVVPSVASEAYVGGSGATDPSDTSGDRDS